MLLCLCAKGAMGQWAQTYPEATQLVTLWNPETKTTFVSIKSKLQEKFNRTDWSTNGGTFYVRWFIRTKGDSSNTPLTNWTVQTGNTDCPSINQDNYVIWTSSFSHYIADLSFACNATISCSDESVDVNNVELCAIIKNGYNDLETDWNQKQIKSEGTIGAFYVFDFKTVDELGFTAGDESNVVSNTIIKLASGNEESFTLNLYDGDVAIADIVTAMNDIRNLSKFYTRWYLEDQSGNIVSDMSSLTCTEGYDYTTQSFGLIWNSSTSTKSLKDQWGNTKDAPSILKANYTYNPENRYKVVCLMTNDLTGMETVGNYVVKEPAFKLKYIFDFKTVDELGFTAGDESNVVSNTIIKLASGNEESFTLNLYDGDVAIADIVTAMNDIRNLSKFYTRWYLEDQSGNIVSDMSSLTCTEGYDYTTQSFGLIWNSSTSTKSLKDQWGNTKDAPSILKANYTYNPENRYKVVCLMTNDLTGMETAGNYVIKEPAFKLKYIFDFKTQAELESMDYIVSTSNPKYEYSETIEVNETDNMVEIPLLILYNTLKGSVFGWGDNNFYLRWYIVDAKGNTIKEITDTETGNLTGLITGIHVDKGVDGLIWTSTSANSSYDKNHLNINYTKGTEAFWSDFKVECVMTNDLTGMKQIGNILLSEPTEIVARVTYSFTDGVDHFLGTLKDGVNSEEYLEPLNSGTSSYTLSNAALNRLQTVFGDNTPKYLRWYLVDVDGNKLEESSEWITYPTNYVAGQQLFHGFYWYGESYNKDLLDVTLSVPSDKNIFNYKLVCVASYDAVASENIKDGEVRTEPNWDVQYTIGFEELFRGDASSATEKEYVMKLRQSQFNKYDEFVIVYDKNDNKVAIQDNTGQELYSIEETVWKELNDISFDDANTPFYIRWFLRDKLTKEETYIAGVLADCSENTFVDGRQKGLYWSNQLYESEEKANALKIKVVTGKTLDITAYELVAHISNLEIPDNYIDETNHVLMHEPDNIQLEYVVKFETTFLSTDSEYSIKNRYLLYNPETRKAIVDFYADEYANMVIFFGKTTETFPSNYYLRWSIENENGNLLPLSESIFVPSQNNNYVLSGSAYYRSSFWASSYTDFYNGSMKMTITLPDGLDYNKHKVSLILTDDLTGAEKIWNEYNNAVVALDNEPTDIKLKYVYHLVTAEDIAQMEFAPTTTASKTYNELVRIASSSETAYTIPLYTLYTNTIQKEIFGGSAPANAYLRWYIADAKGNPIEELTTTETGSLASTGQFAHTSIGADGLIWMSKSATYEYDVNHLNIKYTKGTDAYWGQYKVICLITDELEGMQYVNGTYLADPATIKAKVIYSFTDGVDRFSGSAATDAIDKSFRRELEEDENGVYDKTAQLNLSDDMSDEYRAKLTEGGTVYLRWYVTDKNGNMLSPDASPVSLTLHESDKFHQTEYGYIWYSGYDGEGTFSTDLLNVTATASASVNLYDYNVVCVMTTDVSDATMEDEEFTKESSWEARYTYVFTRAFAGKLADGAKTIYKTLVVSDAATSVNVPLSRRIDEIRSYFGMKSYDELNSHFHIRWALLDNDGNEVYNQGQLVNKNSDNNNYYYENDYGIYWNTKANKNGFVMYSYNVSKLLDVTYTLLANTAWQDYKVVVYMTDDNEEANGVRIETGSDGKSRLVHEPNHLELRYIIDFQTVSEVQSRFVHYKGYTNSDFTSVEGSTTTNNVVFNAQTGEYESVNKDIRQQTHEWTYEIYVKPGGNVALDLPIQDGNNMEPQAYYRWYDWNTDCAYASVGTTRLEGGLIIQDVINGGETNRGLFGSCSSDQMPSQSVVGATFYAPSESWDEIVIACDVSKYADGMDLSGMYLLHEPTLSYRYKYIIRPASKIAQTIEEKISAGSFLEDHGNITIGTYNNSSDATLRLNLDVSNYWFYHKGSESSTSTLCQAKSVQWRVYDASGLYCAQLQAGGKSNNPRFCTISLAELNALYFVETENFGNSAQGKQLHFYPGEMVYVYAYADDGDNLAPIARFNCRFLDNSYPIGVDELPYYRTIDYLENNYTRVALISFDIEAGSTLGHPDYPLRNMNPMPFKWNRSHYGYCYPALYSDLIGAAKQNYGLSPLHGDYTLVKSINLDDVSETGSADGYVKYWWRNEKILRDLTYRYTNENQSGYFLYVDASDESRPIANVEFEGEMCVGSTLILSAMVADMTKDNLEKPQLIFKLYGLDLDINGNEIGRKLIHSFASCDFETVNATETIKWYQVYGQVTLRQNSGVENYQHFLVSIDNYCASTLGADYAIDDIRIYTQNSKVEVKQDAVLCGNDKLSVKLMMKHETLLAMMPSVNPSDYPMPVYYRFCEEDGTPVKGDDFYGAGLNEYGQVDFRYYFYDPSSSISEETAVGTEEKTEELAHHYQKTADGARYFMLSKVVDFSSNPIEYQTYALEPGKKYYVSVAVPEVKTDENGKKYYVLDEHSWGAPTDVCSMYSNPFEPMMQSMKLLFGGTSIDRISVTCGTHETGVDFELTGALQIPDEETGQMVSIENPASCRFDWIVEEKTNDYLSVMTPAFKVAWNAFRYRKGETLDDTPISGEIPESEVNETFTEEHRTLLNQVISAKKLHLLANAKLKGYSYEVGKTYIITALPLDNIVKQTVNGVEKPYTVCPEPMEVTVEARLDGPELDFGFEAVNYESIGMLYGAEGLRVGLDYLENMQEKQIPLHIPINSYKIGGLVQTDYDVFLDELGMIVIDSNDPTWSGYLDGTHRIAYEKDEKHQIDETTKSMEVYFHPKFQIMDLDPKKIPVSREGDDIKFHEGYWYMVKVKYVKEKSELENLYGNRCYGESYLTIKVVPKYMTWGEGLPNNSNWLNDANWRRSSKEELYKVKVNTDGYPVYGDTNESDEVLHQLSNKQGFVPMKFTKVTILSDMPSPYPFLSNLVPNVHTGIIDKQYMYNGDNSAPTENIEYDMMVKITPEICPYKVGTTDLVYECEHFYGNICEQIYFKPRAQLRYQHYLDYEKAWVEMELSANKWMMLTSPFEQLYAGDFYVPAVEEGGVYPYGRQETEAFQDINFGDKSGESALYSRNGFPIYQRSWDKTNSMVVTAEDDALRDDYYDAFIDYEWTEQITSEAEDAEGNTTTTTQTVMKDVDVVATQWSHVYNDMEKLYEPGRGFSVRLHHTDRQEVDGTDTDGNTIYKDKKALLRFPKADTQYHYYDHADEEGHDVKVDKSKHHRLAADGVATGMVQITPIKNADEDNPYYMVGNPYMASVRMELFFNANPHLVKTYWVVSNGAALSATEATGLGIIGPMQSFFVKTEDGQPVTNVLFSPAMTVSHLVSGAAEASETDDAETISFTTRATANVPMAQTRVVLSAEADNGFVDEEDVETLLDSNLEDVPMVYTVAGTQAAMVNCLNDVTLLPLGLFGAEGETVDVQVHGVDRFSQILYFYDASTGKQTALEEGAALSLEANVHGRYFLTTRALEDDAVTDDTDWLVRAYSLQRGELIVAAMPQDNLRQVRIYGVNGHQVVNDAAAQSHVATYALPSGIYVAEVVTERLSRPQVVKVVVR